MKELYGPVCRQAAEPSAVRVISEIINFHKQLSVARFYSGLAVSQFHQMVQNLALRLRESGPLGVDVVAHEPVIVGGVRLKNGVAGERQLEIFFYWRISRHFFGRFS